MKPVSIRFKCFGPYMAEQYIDFEELQRNGLFLICGETGAGKTTILDAMCYALYGRSSGGLRGDMEVMRCKLAQKDDETLVEFIFDCGGNRYKFVRGLKYKTKNMYDSHNCLIRRGDVYVPLLENPKKLAVNRKAEELIGLTYEQFRQVIILPQGQFERLLVSDSAEKEKILVSLFQADRWHQIAKELSRRVRGKDEELKQQMLQIKAKLRDYGCENLDALAQKRQEMGEELELLRQQTQMAERDAEEKKRIYTGALLDAHGFQELAKRQRDWENLAAKEVFYRAEERNLSFADVAEQIYPRYTAWQEAKNGSIRANKELHNRENALNEAKKALEAVHLEQKAHAQRQEEIARQSRELLRLENAREVYTTLAEKQKAVAAAQAALGSAEKSSQNAELRFDSADRVWQESLVRQDRAMTEYREAQSLYLQGIGSVLAEKLTDGEPCPVCGSVSHPSPAKSAEGHVSESQLESINRAMTRANKAVSDAMQERTRADNARRKAKEETSRMAQTLAVAENDWKNAQSRKIPGIDTTNALEQAVHALRGAITAYEQTGELLRRKLTEAEGNLKAAEAGKQSAQETLIAAQSVYGTQTAVWEAALEASELESESRFHACYMEPGERQRRSAALVAYRTESTRAARALEEQKILLEGKSAPNMKELELQMRMAEQASKTMSARLVLEENRLKTLVSDETQLIKRKKVHDEARIGVDRDLAFADRLLGSSGVSLQRYVLAVMMNSITVEANRLLENVYGGRYRLYRTDAISGSVHKGGLELEVYDSQNNQRRSVTTLSGGEKFLVALSLAIGLSTVVQAQGSGSRLEAMFIDEGFGSLDRESVQDALEVLQGIQRSAGVVGIISHVEALAESIPARIEITKGRNGSGCRVVV